MCTQLFLIKNMKESWSLFSGMALFTGITMLKAALMAGKSFSISCMNMIDHM